MNILFTGVGRRIELLEAFREAALTLNMELKIYGADMAGTAPALTYCDYIRKVVAIKDSYYIQNLLDICKNDHIDLVIPTIDTDLLVLAENKEQFNLIGTNVMISSPEMIRICRNKNFIACFFEECGLQTPKTVNKVENYRGDYPAFIKPQDGSSSINAYKVENEDELKVYAEQIEDYIIQPYIEGREYTIDIFCDFQGNPIYITPRERLQVRAGEVLKTKIYLDEEMIEESKKIIQKFKPCGPITVQLIRDKFSNKNFYIEINPRFGGGAPLSMKAGANSAEILLQLLSGKTFEYQESSFDGLVYSRFDQSVCISIASKIHSIKGVIFDLDDTLYDEKEYIQSGFKKIGEYLDRKDASDILWKYYQSGKKAIDEYLQEIGLLERKEECINIYRNHMPDIHLFEGIKELIGELQKRKVKVGIITDGRVIGQNNKIKVLGLDKIIEDIIITDELGGEQFRKPNEISFKIIQTRWRLHANQIIYIGDNLNKDFQAPKQLGMHFIHFNNQNGIYSKQSTSENISADSISSLSKLLLSFTEGR